MANPLASIGNFFSDIGKGAQQMVSDVGGAISKGISNLTGGDNKPQSTPTPTPTPSPKPTPKPTPRPRPSPSPSSGGSSDSPSRSDSAGAKALNEQINSPTNSSTSTTGTENPRIDSFVDSIKDNISDSSDAPKPTTTGAQSESSLPEPTISAVLPDTPIVGTPTIMAGDNKGQPLTPDMITSNKPSGGTGSTSKTDNVVLGGITGVTDGVVNMGGLAGVNPSVNELNQPVPQTSVNTDAMVGLSGKPTLSLLPDDYNPLKVQSTISTLPDGSTWQINMGDDGKATIKNLDKTVGIGTDLIYRDPSMVGIHTFDSKAESEAFLKQLYPDGNFNWGDSDTKWYDPKTGEYIGYLGEEAYPYAVIVPETYDAPVRLEFNTGGQKGGSPVKDTGKSTWADVPSASTRLELRDAGFDYGFASRNLDSQELMNQSEMRGYDSSWYDGMVGQNSIPYDAEKGGYDARTSNVSVADVKSGKVGYDMLSNTPGAQAILDATIRIKEPQQETNVISKWQNPYADWDPNVKLPADRHIENPTPAINDGGIFNNPVELIGTLLGVGALAKVGSIGGKIGGSMIDDWVSAGGKTMSGSNIIDSGVSSMIGGGSVRNLVKPVSEFVSTNNQMKLAEIGGLGVSGIGLFAGKELESPSNVFEIIPQNIFSTEEVEPSSTISGLNEIISSPYYQSELEVPKKEYSNSIEDFKTGSVFEIERVKEKEKEKEKEKTKQKDEGFSYADVPSYTIEDKTKYAQEALKKQLEQEREYEKQKAEEAAKQKEQDRLIEKDSELIFIPTEITKVNEKNKNKVIENNENVIFNYPMKEKTKNKLVHDMVLTRDGLVKNKGLIPFIGGFDGSSSNIFIDDTPFISEVKDTIGGISMGIPKPSPKKDDDDDDYRMGELTGAPIFGRRIGRSWKVYNEDISDANQFTGLF